MPAFHDIQSTETMYCFCQGGRLGDVLEPRDNWRMELLVENYILETLL